MKPVDGSLDASARLRSLLATLQLASPALPVGGFAYSQGLETAIARGTVHDAATARRWIDDALLLSLARWEAPQWLRAYDAAARGDAAALARCNDELLATRETAELRAESQQMGGSLLRVFHALCIAPPALDPVAYPVAFAVACAGLAIERRAGLAAYLWAWVENQVLVAVKSVPLGQQSGQVMLFAAHASIERAVAHADGLRDDELGSGAVGLALASAQHETQYSRLYRS